MGWEPHLTLTLELEWFRDLGEVGYTVLLEECHRVSGLLLFNGEHTCVNYFKMV